MESGWHHIKEFVGLFVDTLQAAVGSDDVQPVGKEQVDLAGVFAQRRKTGGVVGHVECRADTLFRVQLDLGRRRLGLAVAAVYRRQFSPLFCLFFLFFLQRMIGRFCGASSRSGKGSSRNAV